MSYWYDPELDRVVSDAVISRQFEHFRDCYPDDSNGLQKFAEANFWRIPDSEVDTFIATYGPAWEA